MLCRVVVARVASCSGVKTLGNEEDVLLTDEDNGAKGIIPWIGREVGSDDVGP